MPRKVPTKIQNRILDTPLRPSSTMKKGTKVLLTMLVVAALALGFGFYILNQRVEPLQVEQDNTQTLNSPTTPPPTPPVQEEEAPAVSTTGWKVYENEKHVFSLRHPTNLQAGAISDNSVLGTFQAPVHGFHVGPLVLVVLKAATTKKDAQDYFNGVYTAASNPQPAQQGIEVAVECKLETVTNPDVVSVRAVSCTGEGGPAKYAYIAGANYDVFVDGYSKGYGGANYGELTAATDFVGILSTFKFSKAEASSSVQAASITTTTTTTTPPPPAIQSFTITADDVASNPGEITVTKDAIVQVTFKVHESMSSGLDFRSSVVNSGLVAPGNSKTISFKADQSFVFTPYSVANQSSKNYSIKVTVQ